MRRSSSAAPVAAPAVVLTLAWVAGFNFRSGFIGVGPVLPNLTTDLGLAHTQASVLVAIPTLMMGLMAVPGGRLADRTGAERVIAVALALVGAAGAARAGVGTFAPLVALTILFGAGLGLGQPALPRLMRSRFPDRMESATAIYASGMIVGSILGAALTGSVLLGWTGASGWRGPLLVWGVVALVSLAAWLSTLRPWRTTAMIEPSAVRQAGANAPVQTPGVAWSPWRSRGAWLVAWLFAAQGVAYYLLVAWLPSVYAERGFGASEVGLLFGIFNAATLPASLGFPLLSRQMRARRPAALAASLCFLVGAIGFVAAPTAEPWRWLWPAAAGAGVAGLFALGLLMPADVSPPGRTGVAAGMVLAIGYAASALGPILAGAVRDATGSFDAAMALLPAMGLAMVVLSLAAPELPRSGSATTRATEIDRARAS